MTAGPKKNRHPKSSSSSLDLQKLNSTEGIIRNVNSLSSFGVYSFDQQKGQRRYGPPLDWSEEPPRGSEVHVSKLPRDMLEDELIPIFEKIGKLFDIRLMMETSNYNKGFAFVKFCFKEDSESAITKLNDFEIRPNARISVQRSIDNNRLFIGNIPKNYSSDDVLHSMKEESAGVVKVIIYASINDRTKNRGYGFVEFETHQQAKNSRNKLKISPLIWSGQEIKVDWAEPELEIDEETMKKVRILYVRNLSLTTTDQQLRDLFSSFGGEIERVKKIKDYAFIHFATREQAEESKSKLQGKVLDKCEIDISWAKPITNREEYQQRKAASKALSCGPNTTNAVQTPFGFNGEPLIINQRVRTAAGAQGYNASRPYPLRPKHTENTFSSLQTRLLYPNFAFIQDMSMRNTVDTYSLQPVLPQAVYNEHTSQMEDFISGQPDVSYIDTQTQLLHRYPPMFSTTPYSVVASQSALNNCFGAQTLIQPASSTQTFLPASPYVLAAPSITSIQGSYGTAQSFYGGHLMPQISNITGSNMSIDRT